MTDNTEKSKREPKWYNSALNKNIRNFLKNSDYNIEVLAKTVGASVDAVRLWCNGFTRPDLDKVVIICEYFNKTPNELFDFENHNSAVPENEVAENSTLDMNKDENDPNEIITFKTANKQLNDTLNRCFKSIREYIDETISGLSIEERKEYDKKTGGYPQSLDNYGNKVLHVRYDDFEGDFTNDVLFLFQELSELCLMLTDTHHSDHFKLIVRYTELDIIETSYLWNKTKILDTRLKMTELVNTLCKRFDKEIDTLNILEKNRHSRKEM